MFFNHFNTKKTCERKSAIIIVNPHELTIFEGKNAIDYFILATKAIWSFVWLVFSLDSGFISKLLLFPGRLMIDIQVNLAQRLAIKRSNRLLNVHSVAIARIFRDFPPILTT